MCAVWGKNNRDLQGCVCVHTELAVCVLQGSVHQCDGCIVVEVINSSGQTVIRIQPPARRVSGLGRV